MLNILIKSAQLLGAIQVFFALSSAFSGGSRFPDSPHILSAKALSNNAVEITVKLPALRSDRITPLVNLNGLKLFRDSVFVRPIQLTVTDTGKTIRVYDTVAAKAIILISQWR